VEGIPTAMKFGAGKSPIEARSPQNVQISLEITPAVTPTNEDIAEEDFSSDFAEISAPSRFFSHSKKPFGANRANSRNTQSKTNKKTLVQSEILKKVSTLIETKEEVLRQLKIGNDLKKKENQIQKIKLKVAIKKLRLKAIIAKSQGLIEEESDFDLENELEHELDENSFSEKFAPIITIEDPELGGSMNVIEDEFEEEYLMNY
jgi:hypothetical protein